MAFLRKHKRSPYWYLKRRNLDTGLWEEATTGLRADSPSDTRKAQRLAERISVDEKRVGAPGTSPAFLAWVPSYIASHWTNTAGDSTRRYGVAWQAIKAFLAAHDLTYPRQVKYGHGAAYIEWRLRSPVHGKNVQHNTALLELKFLSQLMNESVRREFAESNPLARAGIVRTAAKVKPELTDEDIEKLWEAIRKEPLWMQAAFKISLHTGCRFSECAIPIGNIDFTNWTMRLRDSKRPESDPRKYFTVPIEPPLRPLLRRLKKNGATVTCTLSQDKNGRTNYVFRKCGVNASFHSLRVTFVTRLHRAGVSMMEALRLVNHSSILIHRVYSRLNVDDVRKARAKVKLPRLSER